ncbi:MAG TPA: superinfection immunity protein [Streptosporangiaceae bacterium]|nr:superinfection immunity protein [Streptosporangiaceae bacterium]
MNALTDSFFFWLALIMALGTVYILPSLVAIIRGTENLGLIIVLNLLPTGVGWLAALIAALGLPRKDPSDSLAVRPMTSPQLNSHKTTTIP